MKLVHKQIITLVLLFFILLHFIFIIVYTSPLKQTGKLNSMATLYCYPYFHQQWTVFVPTPHKKFNLYIRNGKNNHWQNWINITDNLIKKRKNNSFVGRETEVLLLSNCINYVAADIGDTTAIFINPPNLASFKVLERASKFYFRNYRCWREGKDYELLLTTQSNKKQFFYYFKNLSLL